MQTSHPVHLYSRQQDSEKAEIQWCDLHPVWIADLTTAGLSLADLSLAGLDTKLQSGPCDLEKYLAARSALRISFSAEG